MKNTGTKVIFSQETVKKIEQQYLMYKRTNRCLDVNGSSVVKKSVPVLMCVYSEHQDAL